jgi:RNA polymerase sigma-70 factor, ECF subfamily
MSMEQPDQQMDYAGALERCALGDGTGLESIYRAEASKLIGVAMRIVRNRDQAEDVVHDAFVHIWAKASGFKRDRGSGRAWIYSVVRNRAIDTIRRKREIGVDDDELERIPDTGDDPVAMLSRVQDGTRLRNCLEQLDDDKRASLLLAYVDGFSQRQIALYFSVPLGTAKAWIRRGLLSLKECIQ